MKNSYDELRSLLVQGYYGDNFDAITQLTRQAAYSFDRPLFFYLIWTIFGHFSDVWGNDDRPLTEKMSDRMESVLSPPMISYLDAVTSGLSVEVQMEYLDQITVAYLQWREIEKTLPWRPGPEF